MSNTQKDASLESVIVSRLKQAIREIETVSRNIVSDAHKITDIQKDIAQKKESNPDLTHTDVLNLILESQEIILMTQLRDKDLREAINNATLLYEICVTQKIETNLSDDDQKEVDQLMSTTKKLFHIDTEKQEMKVIDMEAYNEILAPVRAQIRSDERMREIFNSPVFTKK